MDGRRRLGRGIVGKGIDGHAATDSDRTSFRQDDSGGPPVVGASGVTCLAVRTASQPRDGRAQTAAWLLCSRSCGEALDVRAPPMAACAERRPFAERRCRFAVAAMTLRVPKQQASRGGPRRIGCHLTGNVARRRSRACLSVRASMTERKAAATLRYTTLCYRTPRNFVAGTAEDGVAGGT